MPLAGFRRPNGSPYSMLPDVFVHPLPNPHPESGQTLTFVDLGVPLLAIEVLSAATYRSDLDVGRGKAWSYADAGVREYIAVDYARSYMDEHVRALRLAEGRWARWPADSEGRWQSAALGVSFAYDGLYLRGYDAAGRLKPLPQEADALLLEQAGLLEQHSTALERIRALAAAGDLVALRELLGISPPHDEPPPASPRD